PVHGFGVDFRGGILVETNGELRAHARLDCGDSGEWDFLSLAVANVKLPHVFRLGSEFPLGFDIHLPLAAEAIEVIDEISAHESLDGPVDIVERHTQLQYLVPVHVAELLRHAAQRSEERPVGTARSRGGLAA